MRRVRGAVLVVLLVGACSDAAPNAPAPGGSSVTAPGELPAIAQVWFGSAFDPATFALTDKTTAAKKGAPLVAIGHLNAAKSPEEVSVDISTGGSVVKTLPVAAGPSGPSEIYGVDLTVAKLGAGTYIISFVDKSGRVLASKTIRVQ
jgi:hypothetical protein